MKKSYTLIIVMACAIIVSTGCLSCRSSAIGQGFKLTKVGDTEIQILKLMGKPSKVVLPGDKEYWSSHISGSVKEYHYNAKILPEIWVIGFDAKGIVVYRNHNVM